MKSSANSTRADVLHIMNTFHEAKVCHSHITGLSNGDYQTDISQTAWL